MFRFTAEFLVVIGLIIVSYFGIIIGCAALDACYL